VGLHRRSSRLARGQRRKRRLHPLRGAASAGRGHGPARPLEAARLYRVEINARPANGDSSTLGYEARFCVKPQAGGVVDVRVVRWDESARRWRDEVCLRD
jgi:hypothetical protein